MPSLIEVWREVFSGYADTAALLAVWTTEADPNGTGTWTLDATRALDGTACLRFHRSGNATAGWVFSLTRVVPGLTPSTDYALQRTVYRTGAISTGVVDAWDPEATAVTSDGSGNVTVTMTFTIGVSSTATTADKWFDQIRLIQTVPSARATLIG